MATFKKELQKYTKAEFHKYLYFRYYTVDIRDVVEDDFGFIAKIFKAVSNTNKVVQSKHFTQVIEYNTFYEVRLGHDDSDDEKVTEGYMSIIN